MRITLKESVGGKGFHGFVRRFVALGEIDAGRDRPVVPMAPGEEPAQTGGAVATDYSGILQCKKERPEEDFLYTGRTYPISDSTRPSAPAHGTQEPRSIAQAAFLTVSCPSRATRFKALTIALSDAVTMSGLIPTPWIGFPLSTRNSTYDAAWASAPAPIACSW